jgi:hypothetical protein
MGLAAIVWLGYEFWRLLFQPGVMGAVDLLLRRDEVQRWFAGLPVYTELRTATYPPASMVLLWPFTGWLDASATRWVWAATTLLALGWLVALLIRESGARNRAQRVFGALLLLSTYAAGAAIGNGQLIVLVLPLLVAAFLLLRRNRGWSWNLLAAGLLVASLVKPTLSAPFFWLVLFAVPGVWPALLAAVAYVGLTVFAAQFQPVALLTLLTEWLQRSEATASGSMGVNVYAWFTALGLRSAAPIASVLLLAGLGVWVLRYRRADPWLLLGVTGLVTEFWSYHLWYDDLVLILPTLTFFRLALSGPTNVRPISRLFLGALILTDLAPGGLYVLPEPLRMAYVATQTVVRLASLAYLVYVTYRATAAGAQRLSPPERAEPPPQPIGQASV